MHTQIPRTIGFHALTKSLCLGLFFCAVFGLGIKMLSDPPSPVYETTLVDPFANADGVTPPFSMPAIAQPIFPDRICAITDYGAVPGPTNNNMVAIADAIADCSRQGGGHVIVPKGSWLTGAIHLENAIDLHLDPGAILSFSADSNDYLPVVLSRYEGTDVYNYSPLIYAYGKHNIAITGTGTLIGNGKRWLDLGDVTVTHELYAMGDRGVPIPDRVFGSQEKMLRPAFVEFVHCDAILLQDFSIESGPMWTLHPTYSHDIIVRNVSVRTNGQNNDGLDIDSSQNVLVENSYFDTNDDAIALKSGKARDGLTENIPTENVIIRNNTVENGHAGIAIGSEIAGGVRNVFAYGLKMHGGQYGIRLKALETERVWASDLWFQNIAVDKMLFDAVQMTMHYGSDQAEGEPTGVPTFDGIHFSDISSPRTRRAIEFDAIESSPIKNVTMEHTVIGSGTGVVMKNVDGITLQSIAVQSKYDPLFSITNGQNVAINDLGCVASNKVCASIDGSTTHNISLIPAQGTALNKNRVLIGSDVPTEQVSY